MNNYSIIFDLDGTLWNSTETVSIAWQNVLKDMSSDLNLSIDDFKSITGLTVDEIEDKLFSNLDKEKRQAILNKCLEEENVEIRKRGAVLFPNVIETIKRLSKTYDLYIVSNCQSGYIESFLAYYHLESYFKDIECNGNNNLPKADNIKLIIFRNNIGDCCYIGDTIYDYKSAKECGIPFIFAAYGFGEVDDYDAKIDSIDDIDDAIKKIR